MREIQAWGDDVIRCGTLFGWRLDALLIGATVSLLTGGCRRLTALPGRSVRRPWDR